ncbi:MAG: DEAD/DEAH box helicase [Actinobacteria bacterium]|nr:DEAD/DEAH box helicase [Actinomycetota bacterium]
MDPEEFEKASGFEMDGFQREAIGHLSRGRSVLVAAPTGSGKTVVAEYALEKARAEGRSFFYTTPLKALSNQKFRDLSRDYGADEVGLLTGDNSINGEAPLVVMTTEVLRNMIYEGSPLLDRLGAVVLDEVHYLHDPFRGGVWEEIVIMLPGSIKIVALSATVSNAGELGSWMNSLRGDVEVVISEVRPVTLKNYYFVGQALEPLFSQNLHRVINEQLERLKKAPAPRHGRSRRMKGPDLRPRRVEVIEELQKKGMLPAIYFLFSRAACDDSALMWLSEGGTLNNRSEANAVSRYLEEKVHGLSEADLECLRYPGLRSALMAGVAVHHAGILPLFKEAVEELFAGGLLKVVFATETLSLGINMPASTVVIESLSKWGGDKHRTLTSGEYKQLTGRAGRRGIDEVGHAVVLHQRYFSHDAVRSLVKKEASPVVSSFGVSYNMAVNILAERDLAEAQKLLNLTFAQYVADRRVLDLAARLETFQDDLQAELAASRCEQGDAAAYRELEKKHSRLARKLAGVTKRRRRRQVDEAVSRLKPGDVFISGAGEDARVQAVVRRQKGKQTKGEILVVDPNGRYRKLQVSSVTDAPQVVGSVDVDKISSPTKKVRRSVGAKMESAAGGAPPLDADAGRSAEEEAVASRVAQVKEERQQHPCHECKHRRRCLEAARRAEKTERQVKATTREMDARQDVVSRRLADVVVVLGEFGFMDGDDVTRKGEVLRRVYNECDLLLVEALDRGIVSRLEPRELAAFASWFVYESREGETESERRVIRQEREHLEGAPGVALEELDAILSSMKEREAEKGLDLLGSLDTGFGEAVFLWSGGMELEGMLERFLDWSVGDMVRMMKQILDLLRQLAEVSPDYVLTENLKKAMDLIDRGVVGHSSLESILEHEGCLRP